MHLKGRAGAKPSQYLTVASGEVDELTWQLSGMIFD